MKFIAMAQSPGETYLILIGAGVDRNDHVTSASLFTPKPSILWIWDTSHMCSSTGSKLRSCVLGEAQDAARVNACWFDFIGQTIR